MNSMGKKSPIRVINGTRSGLDVEGGVLFDAVMSKRQLGITFLLLGIVAAIGIVAVDLIGAGNFQGVGPAQRLALLGAGAVALVGLTLIPLGDKPA